MIKCGERVIHAVHAFGVCESIDGDVCIVNLDNGQSIATPLVEWYPAVVTDFAVLDVEALTDEELDNELARYQAMRVEGAVKRRKHTPQEKAEKGYSLREMLALAKNDPELMAVLKEKGIVK